MTRLEIFSKFRHAPRSGNRNDFRLLSAFQHFHLDLEAIVDEARAQEQKHPERLATVPPATPAKR